VSLPKIDHRDLMLASSGKALSKRPGWIFELKHDGFRSLSSKVGRSVRVLSRSGRDMSPQFPDIAEALLGIPHDFVIDGELVIVDETGRTDWARFRTRASMRKPERVVEAAVADPAAIFAFDLLWCDGEDYRHFPLVVRKAMLRTVLRGSKRIIYTQHIEGSPAELWALAKKFDQEGIVARDATSPYSAGRTDRWVKIKTAAGAEREKARGRHKSEV
jgi:bifunctional non-homologous end joining protein LigD